MAVTHSSARALAIALLSILHTTLLSFPPFHAPRTHYLPPFAFFKLCHHRAVIQPFDCMHGTPREAQTSACGDTYHCVACDFLTPSSLAKMCSRPWQYVQSALVTIMGLKYSSAAGMARTSTLQCKCKALYCFKCHACWRCTCTYPKEQKRKSGSPPERLAHRSAIGFSDLNGGCRRGCHTKYGPLSSLANLLPCLQLDEEHILRDHPSFKKTKPVIEDTNFELRQYDLAVQKIIKRAADFILPQL